MLPLTGNLELCLNVTHTWNFLGKIALQNQFTGGTYARWESKDSPDAFVLFSRRRFQRKGPSQQGAWRRYTGSYMTQASQWEPTRAGWKENLNKMGIHQKGKVRYMTHPLEWNAGVNIPLKLQFDVLQEMSEILPNLCRDITFYIRKVAAASTRVVKIKSRRARFVTWTDLRSNLKEKTKTNKQTFSTFAVLRVTTSGLRDQYSPQVLRHHTRSQKWQKPQTAVKCHPCTQLDRT